MIKTRSETRGCVFFFISRTTAPDISKFTTMFVNIFQILNCHNRDPRTNTQGLQRGSKLNIEICRENVKKNVSLELQCYNVCDYFAGIHKF